MPDETDARVVRRWRRIDWRSGSECAAKIDRSPRQCAAENGSVTVKIEDECPMHQVVTRRFSHRDTNTGEECCA